MNEHDDQLSIELNDEVAEGTFANLAFITHGSAEFILDFIRIMPGVPKAKVKSRIIMTPEHAKRFLKALENNIQRYEAEVGEIRVNDEPNFPMGGFGGPTAEA